VGCGYQSTGGEPKHRTSIDDLCKPTGRRICSRCDVYLCCGAVEDPFPQVGVPSALDRPDLIDFDDVMSAFVGGLSLRPTIKVAQPQLADGVPAIFDPISTKLGDIPAPISQVTRSQSLERAAYQTAFDIDLSPSEAPVCSN
jgi:hypothetical protein